MNEAAQYAALAAELGETPNETEETPDQGDGGDRKAASPKLSYEELEQRYQ